MVTLAKQNWIQVILASQPLEPDKNSFEKHTIHKPFNDIVVYPQHEEFVSYHVIFNTIIQKVAMEANCLLLDNQKAVSSEKGFFFDHVHFNPKGIKALAENCVNLIMQNADLLNLTSSKDTPK